MRIKGGADDEEASQKIIKQAKGYRDKRHNVYNRRRAVMMAGKNSYVGRKLEARFRTL